MNDNVYLIFDFDGTLVDSFYAIMEKFNLLADKFNFRKISHDEIDHARHLSSHGLIKYLEIPIHKIPRILRSAKKHMHDEMQMLLPFEHIPEALQELYERAVPMGILTSNSLENVIKWLKLNKMQHLFKFIQVESSYFGKGCVLKKILKTHKIDKSQAFYIGDETRDIEAAKECGVYSVAVTWGFHAEEILLQHQPHYMVRKPEDLCKLTKESIQLSFD